MACQPLPAVATNGKQTVDSGDAGVVGAVAHADVHRSAAAYDGDHCGSGLFRAAPHATHPGLVSGLPTLRQVGLVSLLSFIIIGDSAHQRGMGLIAIQPILLESSLFWKAFTADSVLLPKSPSTVSEEPN